MSKLINKRTLEWINWTNRILLIIVSVVLILTTFSLRSERAKRIELEAETCKADTVLARLEQQNLELKKDGVRFTNLLDSVAVRRGLSPGLGICFKGKYGIPDSPPAVPPKDSTNKTNVVRQGYTFPETTIFIRDSGVVPDTGQ